MFGIYAKANRNKKSDDEKNSAKEWKINAFSPQVFGTILQIWYFYNL